MKTKTNKYIFFIGSNNETKKPEIERAISLMNIQFKGFTIQKGNIGLWENQKEKSFKIEIINTPETPINDKRAVFLKRILEKELKQYLVLTEKTQITLLN